MSQSALQSSGTRLAEHHDSPMMHLTFSPHVLFLIMHWVKIKNSIFTALTVLDEHHTLSFSAGLAYYFVLSIFPLLIVMAAVLAYLPIPNLFGQILGMASQVVPRDSMGMVRRIIGTVVLSRHGGLLTFGVLFSVWSGSSGFAAMIEALNVVYGVPETRRIWTTRGLAIGLTFLVGILMVVAFGVLAVGPMFGRWLAQLVGLSPVFAALWPYLRWLVAVSFTVLAVELLYFWGPDLHQRFTETLPGAVIAVTGWIGVSYLLGIYFQHFANYNKTYGTLGAAIALSVWFYWTSFVMLIGAELNSQLLPDSGVTAVPREDRRRTDKAEARENIERAA